MEEIVTLLKAVSDKNRLRILAALMDGKALCACQITALLGVTGPTVSRHLAQLTRSGLVGSRKEGRWIFFSLVTDRAPQLMDWLAHGLAGSPQLTTDTAALADILSQDREEICRRQKGEACCPSPNPKKT